MSGTSGDPGAERARGAPEPTDSAAGAKAEEQLRISEERHRLLAEAANDVIWTMSPDGRITYVSPAVERMRGITPEEAESQPIEEALQAESAAVARGYLADVAETIKAGLPPKRFRGELEHCCMDGPTVWTEVQVLPCVGPDGAAIELLGVVRDISDRKRHEAELARAREEAEAANRALQAANAALHRLATIDTLTGAGNRRHLQQAAETAVAAARRYGEPLSLLIAPPRPSSRRPCAWAGSGSALPGRLSGIARGEPAFPRGACRERLRANRSCGRILPRGWLVNGPVFAYSSWKRTRAVLVAVVLLALSALVLAPAASARPVSSAHASAASAPAIAFTRGDHVWTVSPDGSGRKQLTSGKVEDGVPVWSPDHATVAFVRQGTSYKTSPIYTVPAAGGTAQLLYKDRIAKANFLQVTGLAYSPDGTKLAFADTYSAKGLLVGTRLVILDIESGRTSVMLTKNGGFGHAIVTAWHLAWSPDGAAILISQQGQDDEGGGTWVYTIISGATKKIPVPEASTADWAADGESVLLSVSTPVKSSIKQTRLDGTVIRTLATGGGLYRGAHY